LSKAFLPSIFSLANLSSSANYSASLILYSISSLDNLPESLVIVISSEIPDEVSAAETFKIPSASISKVTSIWGTPLGYSGIPVKSNFPNK